MKSSIAAAWSLVPVEAELFGELGEEDVPPLAASLPPPPVPVVRAAQPRTATATSRTAAATQGQTGRRRGLLSATGGGVATRAGSATIGGTPTGSDCVGCSTRVLSESMVAAGAGWIVTSCPWSRKSRTCLIDQRSAGSRVIV